MTYRTLSCCWTTVLWTVATAAAHAQSPEPSYLYPPGIQAGQTVEVDLVGKQLDAVTGLHFSRAGIEAKPVGKARMAVTVPANAAPGDCDVWAVSPTGLGAPCRLSIGQLPELTEKEPNNDFSTAQAVDLPRVVNGRMDSATDSDWYRVHLKAGEGLTIACRSLALGGTLWPSIVVADPQGREILHDRMTHLEPTLNIRAPEAGDYSIAVQDRSYRSTSAPFYRLSLTTGPYLATAFPTALERGKSQSVTVYGYRLPSGKAVAGAHDALESASVEIAAPSQRHAATSGWTLSRAMFVEAFEYHHPGAAGTVRFELLDRTPLRMPADASSLGQPAQAMRLTPPADVVGMFSSPRQAAAWYRFSAKAGQTMWLEAVAERVDRPCDLELIVHDAMNKPLETIGNIAVPRGETSLVPYDSRDPAGSWKAPADGDYLLAVRDLLTVVASPAERAYRLSLGPRLEDFRVVAMLGEATAARGWGVAPGKSITVPLTVVRRGGHQGTIEIRAEDLPPGLKIAPLTIAGDKATGNLMIEALSDAQPWVGPIRLVAASELNRKTRTQEILAAMPLPGAPASTRLVDSPVVAILGK